LNQINFTHCACTFRRLRRSGDRPDHFTAKYVTVVPCVDMQLRFLRGDTPESAADYSREQKCRLRTALSSLLMNTKWRWERSRKNMTGLKL